MPSERARAPEVPALLAQLVAGGRAAPRTLVLAAHPDDEIVGLGGHIDALPDLLVVYVTDGAPRAMDDARRAGFEVRADYAAARREEAETALRLAGHDRRARLWLDYVDQETIHALPELIRRVRDIVRGFRPALVLTHPYEGGHPDHDTCALAAAAALRSLAPAETPLLAEFTSYHRGPGGALSFDFLPAPGVDPLTVTLDPGQLARKRRLLACHATQQHVLRWFPAGIEAFRAAPPYDFTRAPHPGALHYEQLGWPLDGTRWRRLAAAALR